VIVTDQRQCCVIQALNFPWALRGWTERDEIMLSKTVDSRARQSAVGKSKMTAPLLKTKLYIPPVRPERVPRPRLIEQLDAGLWPGSVRENGLLQDRSARKLILIARFFTYLIAAIETVQADVGANAQSLFQSPHLPPLKTALTVLINDLATIPANLVLALGDYHVITQSAIHDALAFLVEHAPPQVRLVIASRADPPLPLARLRTRNQLTELRAADLRFTRDESLTFLNGVMALGLSTENVAALEARTEGWIAGLQLAALCLCGAEQTWETFTLRYGRTREKFPPVQFSRRSRARTVAVRPP
jgi:LuxR family maltose regulon positive regulatory protein